MIRCIACAEARSAECCLHDSACLDKLAQITFVRQIRVDRKGGRIYAQRELACTDRLSAKEIGGFDDIRVGSACTAGNDALLDLQFSVLYFVKQRIRRSALGDLLRCLFRLSQTVFKVRIELIDLNGVRRMERERNHRFDRGKIDVDASVVICYIRRVEFLIILRSAV